ncbi:hypothetical protein NAEGRDRAFT_81548 [Naegleria gruberi]|uniref:ODAD1 central coiled coil region domain-containing protein n=1 Tax=Naegleria gruberi TaxID=5762 RepID=D2VX32_NAEGR|nr:uncharacterized protein NAEGRDRAFT_81548 [Naegleria gruberi]EFC38551.1 hypothetical protein NAEGRDRAFT_81548 [Naegleria gruberi]|eukprot:XP_002671295.1 hypothetical protein NAEGRDRAFT_81548 [Naegleria gruberi strain NEG-M]
MPLSSTSDSSPTPVAEHDDEELNTDSLKKTQKKNVNTVKKVKNMSDGALSKQRFTIDKIKKDNDLLRETIANLTRNVNTSESVALGKKINKLNDVIYNITLKIQEEKRKVENLEEHFKDTSNRIEEARIERSGVNVSKESNRLVEKQIKVLENRLDKALVKFNESLTENKVLRDQIENLRKERVVFDSIYKKMEKELQEKKKEMAKIIELSNSAYEERGQALEEQKQVKDEHQKEIEKIEEEREQLDRLLKEAEKVTEKLQQRELERREREIQEAADLDRKRMLKSSWSNSGVKARATDMNEKRKQYEERFSKIEEATGKNIDELIEHFSQSEDQNFSLFTYVNELNSEIEKLEENIVEIEEEIKKFKGEGVNSESQRKKVLSDIQEKINETNSKTDLYQRKYENSLKTLEIISRGIETIFNKLGCDPSSISDMLGTTGVTESNMMIYLGFIEQRTNEIVQMSVTTKKSEGKKDDNAVSGPKHPVGFTETLSIEPPSTANDGLSDDDDDDEEERPFTREELMQKAKKSTLSKKPKKKK